MKNTDPYARALFDNSIERMINTTIKILMAIEPKAKGALAEDVSVNLMDWQDLKSHVVRCWNEARNAEFIKANQAGA